MTTDDQSYTTREQYESDIPEPSEDEYWDFTPADPDPRTLDYWLRFEF